MTQTPIKSLRLEAASASGCKFYLIEINEATGGYTVDFNYGAVGGSVKAGTKTPKPVPLDQAEKIFDTLRTQKEHGDSHYRAVQDTVLGVVQPMAGTIIPEPGGFRITQTHDPLTGQPWAPGEGPNRPACIPPRLLNDVDHDAILNLTKLDNWWVQIKHDGDRVQLHSKGGEVTLFSGRSAKLRACPQAIVDCMAAHRLTTIIDGELVGDTLWAFDLLGTDGVDWTPLPYWERYGFLSAIVQAIGCPTIKLVESAGSEPDKAALILNAKETHAEGVCFLNKNAAYKAGRPNRGGDNLRWKFKASASVIVHSHNEERGKKSISVRLFGETEPIGTCSVIGKTAHPVGSVVEVEYLYAMGSLVQCVLKGPRHDIPHEACTRAQLRFKGGIDPSKGKTA